jgi:rSAM/selenodomain-associated transferase 1
MGKVPGGAAVKSRLHPALGAAMATRLYECFLLDRLDALSLVDGIDRVVAFTPLEARESMATLAPPGFTLVGQRGADLGERLHNVLSDLLSTGHPGAMAVDSDSPTLPMAYVTEAATRLATNAADVTVGPCDDGGYYLIGLSAPHPELFDDMPWSTDRVFQLTIERARRSQLRIHVLPTWFDVDTAEDLRRLHREIELQGRGPRRTCALVRELFASGVLAAA